MPEDDSGPIPVVRRVSSLAGRYVLICDNCGSRVAYGSVYFETTGMGIKRSHCPKCVNKAVLAESGKQGDE